MLSDRKLTTSRPASGHPLPKHGEPVGNRGAGRGDVPVVSIDDLPRTAHRARCTIDVRTLTFEEGGLTSNVAPLPSHYATRNIDDAPRRIDAKK